MFILQTLLVDKNAFRCAFWTFLTQQGKLSQTERASAFVLYKNFGPIRHC